MDRCNMFRKKTFAHLKFSMPSLEEIIIFSDGSGSQFKNRYTMKYLSILSSEFNISV